MVVVTETEEQQGCSKELADLGSRLTLNRRGTYLHRVSSWVKAETCGLERTGHLRGTEGPRRKAAGGPASLWLVLMCLWRWSRNKQG